MAERDERRVMHDPVILAADLRQAAIDVMDGRSPSPTTMALLLEAAASTLLAGVQHRPDDAAPLAPATDDPRLTPGQQRLARVKERHPRAYEPWSEEEDVWLRQQHAEGRSVADIAQALERQPSAITSRLNRLGLLPAPR